MSNPRCSGPEQDKKMRYAPALEVYHRAGTSAKCHAGKVRSRAGVTSTVRTRPVPGERQAARDAKAAAAPASSSPALRFGVTSPPTSDDSPFPDRLCSGFPTLPCLPLAAKMVLASKADHECYLLPRYPCEMLPPPSELPSGFSRAWHSRPGAGGTTRAPGLALTGTANSLPPTLPRFQQCKR